MIMSSVSQDDTSFASLLSDTTERRNHASRNHVFTDVCDVSSLSSLDSSILLLILLLLLMILTSLGLSHILVLSLSSLSSVLKKLCDTVQSVFAFHVCVDIGFFLFEEVILEQVILACR
ncbi:hypothetical protein GEMRC1_014133 [Eukaryota sp. GEM-RC1]